MYGPVPIGLRSNGVVCRSTPAKRCFGTITLFCRHIMKRNVFDGCGRSKRTVSASTFVTVTGFPATMNAGAMYDLFLGSSAAWTVNTTSSAVNGCPSCHVTPLRKWNTYVLPPLLTSQDCARAPCGSRLPSKDTSPSNVHSGTRSRSMSKSGFVLSITRDAHTKVLFGPGGASVAAPHPPAVDSESPINATTTAQRSNTRVCRATFVITTFPLSPWSSVPPRGPRRTWRCRSVPISEATHARPSERKLEDGPVRGPFIHHEVLADSPSRQDAQAARCDWREGHTRACIQAAREHQLAAVVSYRRLVPPMHGIVAEQRAKVCRHRVGAERTRGAGLRGSYRVDEVHRQLDRCVAPADGGKHRGGDTVLA